MGMYSDLKGDRPKNVVASGTDAPPPIDHDIPPEAYMSEVAVPSNIQPEDLKPGDDRQPAYELLMDVAEEAFHQITTPEPGLKLAFWDEFNRMTGGLRPHEVWMVTAPTGIGKTQLNANISVQLLMNSIPHFVASVETGRHDYVKRMVSAIESKDYNDDSPRDEEEIRAVAGRLHKLFKKNNIIFSKYEDRVPIKVMVQTLYEVYERFGCRVAILDNLNFFMKPLSQGMERAEFDDAIHELIIAGKRLPMTIWLILHPKKTDDGRVNSEFDIRGSALAVQEASNVMLINRPTDQDIKNGTLKWTDRELWFKKLRKRGYNVGNKIFLRYENGLYSEIGFERSKKQIFFGGNVQG